MASSMDNKPETKLNPVGLIAKKVAKGFAYALLVLLLIYAAFKVWEYQAESDHQQTTKILNQQKYEAFLDLSKYQAAYSPLIVGGSSLAFAKLGIGESIFSNLLGVDYPVFIGSLEESAPIVYVGPQILGSGCNKSDCTVSKAAFLIDPAKGRMYAGMVTNGKSKYYGLADGEPVPVALGKWSSAEALERTK